MTAQPEAAPDPTGTLDQSSSAQAQLPPPAVAVPQAARAAGDADNVPEALHRGTEASALLDVDVVAKAASLHTKAIHANKVG